MDQILAHPHEPSDRSTTEASQPRRLSSGANSLSSSSINTVRAEGSTQKQNGYAPVGLGNSPRGSSKLQHHPDQLALHISGDQIGRAEEASRSTVQEEADKWVAWQNSAPMDGTTAGHQQPHNPARHARRSRSSSDGFRHGQATSASTMGRAIGEVLTGAPHKRDSLVERMDKMVLRRNGSLNSREPRMDNTLGKPQDGVAPRRIRSISEREKKLTLSKALQKANDAVLLDNAQNYRDAIYAYNEACNLLVHVMGRTTGEDDKNKLNAIRNTYANRIVELQRLSMTVRPPVTTHGSSREPPSAETSVRSLDGTVDYGDISPVLASASLNRATSQSLSGHLQNSSDTVVSSYLPNNGGHSSNIHRSHAATTSQTPLASFGSFNDPSNPSWPMGSDNDGLQNITRPGKSGSNRPGVSQFTTAGQTENRYPLENTPMKRDAHRQQMGEANIVGKQPLRETEGNPSGSSNSSPHHSVSSFEGIHRKRLHARADSGATEAAFDAALDAAVEAAYGNDYEPYDDRHSDLSHESQNLWSHQRSNSRSLARNYHAGVRSASGGVAQKDMNALGKGFGDVDTDDEERILDDLTKGFGLHDTRIGVHTQSAVPRGSDSSSLSNTTFGSSATSSMTAGTSLSAVDEAFSVPTTTTRKFQFVSGASINGAPAPPPQGPLPLPPAYALSPSRTPSAAGNHESSTVQERRGPGSNSRKLTIETMVGSTPGYVGSKASALSTGPSQYVSPVTPDKTNGRVLRPERILSLSSSTHSISPQRSSRHVSPSFALVSPLGPSQGRSPGPSNLSPEGQRTHPHSGSPAEAYFTNRPVDRSWIKKSLPSMTRTHRPVLTSMSEDIRTSHEVPLDPALVSISSPFTRPSEGSSHSSAPTITHAEPVKIRDDYFANATKDVNNSSAQRSTRVAPQPLEPCPLSPMLRPFWLMRCLYETVAHPKGGYLSQKMFVPREVWKMKNVKLKHVEDKVVNLQLLTDALLKLGALEVLDTGAILHEMQSLEVVLDQVQINLVKKLGSDVGPQSISTMFKDAGGEPSSNNGAENTQKEHKSTSKSVIASWRKLRGKPLIVQEPPTTSMVVSQQTSHTDSFSISSVPMTSDNGMATSWYSRRGAQVKDMRGEGPNAPYMSAIAKLCYAAQVLDQIARQVADPDFKHSSPTRMGLELSIRHAAEFFGLYVCRFILQDIIILTNKLLKRSTEWVLV